LLKCASYLFLENLATASGRLGGIGALSENAWRKLCIEVLEFELNSCDNPLEVIWLITEGKFFLSPPV
jgi:hypothetical protein